MKGIVALAFMAGLALGVAAVLGVMRPAHRPHPSPASAAILVDRLRAVHEDLGRHLAAMDAPKASACVRSVRRSVMRMTVAHVHLRETRPAQLPPLVPPVPPAPIAVAEVSPPPVESISSLPTPPPTRSVAAATPRARSVSSDREAYTEALRMYEAGRHTQARRHFATFVRQFVDSPLTPNALYWTGETWYAQGRYAQAEAVFIDVATRYPRHPKGADALLKAAYSALRRGDQSQARGYLQRLQANYAGSPAADLGRRAYEKLPRLASSLETAHG